MINVVIVVVFSQSHVCYCMQKNRLFHFNFLKIRLKRKTHENKSQMMKIVSF